MKRQFHILLVLAVCVVAALAFAATEAEARSPYGAGCGYGWGDGYYFGFYRRNVMSDQLPPYFSQFPPVYYAGPPIPRTYGWSPFALRPTEFDSIPQLAVKPAMIRNPYVPEADKKQADQKPTSDKTARVEPKMIFNPYVTVETPASVASHSLDR